MTKMFWEDFIANMLVSANFNLQMELRTFFYGTPSVYDIRMILHSTRRFINVVNVSDLKRSRFNDFLFVLVVSFVLILEEISSICVNTEAVRFLWHFPRIADVN